jgi:branched-chain amino acid transport system substrate-binding protein
MGRSGSGTKWRLGASGAAVLFAAAMISGHARDAAAQSSEPFKIGAIFPMTGNGAPTGAGAEAGARLAIKELNARGGIMGRQIQLVLTDDQFDPTQSVSLARRLASTDKVQAILGPQASVLALAVGPVLGEMDIAFFTAGVTTAFNPQVLPTGYSLSMLPAEQAVSVVDWAISARKAKSIAFLGDDGSNSKGIAARLKSYAEEKGLTVTGMEQFQFGSSDMTPQLLNLRRGNPEVLHFNGLTAPDQGRILLNIEEIGWKDVALVGGVAFTGLYTPIVKMAGPAVARVLAAVQIKSFTYCSNDPVGESPYAKFRDRLKAESPDSFANLPISLSAWTYDSVLMIKAAAEGANSTSGHKMADWIDHNSAGVEGITGLMKAGPTTRFLGRPETYALAEHLDQIRSDGLMKRVGC